MPKPLKFPDPNDYPQKHPALLCPTERVRELYKQHTGDSAQRISKKVKDWFAAEAHAVGWAGVRFLPEVQTQHSGGAILWQKPRVQITVTQNTLVLTEVEEDTDEEDDE